MIWDPDLYGRYAAARRRPAEELLARVRHPNPRLVVDLGCGRGEMARAMAIRWPAATVLGVDRSEEMLAAAAAEEGRVRWVHAAIERWRPPGPVDVLFSNAALHWLPDHAGLLPELVDTLAPGGVLAVQMPLSWDEPSHRALREVLAAGGVDRRPWGSDRLRSRYGRRPVADPEWYEELLRPRLEELDIWVTRYLHVLDAARLPAFCPYCHRRSPGFR